MSNCQRSNCARDNSNKTTVHTKNRYKTSKQMFQHQLRDHGTCVLNYYASGSTCKLTEEMTFYVGFFCLFVPPPLLSSICQSGLMENDL